MSTKVDNNVLQNLGLTANQTPAAPKDKLDQNAFLKLMVAQLKNQDPMKPMQNGEFLAQMAQFSTVTGVQELQTSFSQLANAMQSSQALQASSLVGRAVLVPAESAVLAPGGNLAGAVDLPASTAKLTLSVYDPAGQIVRSIDLGSQTTGLVNFKWDGKTDAGDAAPAGSYSIAASAVIDGKPAAVDTLIAATVESVTLGRGGQGPTLNVSGLGPMALANVRQVM